MDEHEEDVLYKVVEVVDGEVRDKLITSPSWQPGVTYDYNRKQRIYTGINQARGYKKRLEKDGRRPIIIKYVAQDVVD
ncbi:hypothetical protein SEA_SCOOBYDOOBYDOO_253 [Mycobacterium phage ScoobyDoobyDoo]|nr:hypothetical protein SEA_SCOOBYDOOBYDOO_253 [Mycobacterium phage ScoobyDoobyDoo]